MKLSPAGIDLDNSGEYDAGAHMKVLIAGGSGFLGTALKNSLVEEGHEVFVLTRRKSNGRNKIQWDGQTTKGWGHLVNDMDAVANLTG